MRENPLFNFANVGTLRVTPVSNFVPSIDPQKIK